MQLNKKIIKFKPLTEFVEKILPAPDSATSFIPKWYRNLPSYYNGGSSPRYSDDKDSFDLTAKKCIPMLDSMCSGYMLRTQADMLFDFDENGKRTVTWKTPDMDVAFSSKNFQYTLISMHETEQVGDYPIPEGYGTEIFKFNNLWVVETPKEYSCLFMHPLGRMDLPFYSLHGMVDSDIYNSNPIHIPFVIKKDFVGIVEAGTPYAQLIPIPREHWRHKILKSGDALYDYVNQLAKINLKIQGWYKKNVWKRKEYR